LDEFLYALSASNGADPTRAAETGRSATRNGEPDGEIGLVNQSDHGLWQDQTGGPTDPQPGNIPGGPRDVLRSADFNDGSASSFAVDSGVWQVTGGSLTVAAGSIGGDAAAVFYLDDYLPIYYEISSTIRVAKPTSGWKANAYVIFDYWSEMDFKFAGIDVATNKFVMGRRTTSGWIVDQQSPLQVKPDTNYSLLVAVNGTTVTVTIGTSAMTRTFAGRVIGGQVVGLNKGMVGAGSDNSRGVWDNFAVKVIPPAFTTDYTETFDDGAANDFTGPTTGSWQVTGGRYIGTSAAMEPAVDVLLLPAPTPDSYLEVSATLRTSGVGGLIFDTYDIRNFKFVALDVPGQRVLIGHWAPNGGWTVDNSVARPLSAASDYALVLVMRGASVSVSIGGQFVLSWGFNAPAVDGWIGVIGRTSTTSFDQIRVRSTSATTTAAIAPMTTATAAVNLTTGLPSNADNRSMTRALEPPQAHSITNTYSAADIAPPPENTTGYYASLLPTAPLAPSPISVLGLVATSSAISQTSTGSSVLPATATPDLTAQFAYDSAALVCRSRLIAEAESTIPSGPRARPDSSIAIRQHRHRPPDQRGVGQAHSD
jgi:hypothetical protein